MYELLKEFIKPELLILVPVMWVIGYGIKRSGISNTYIPLILGGISVVLSVLYVFAVAEVYDWRSIMAGAFTAITQGILTAGASVYVNQVIKQARKEQ